MSTKFIVQRYNGKKWKTYSVYGTHAHAKKWYVLLVDNHPNYEWRIMKRFVQTQVFEHHRGKGA